MSAVCCLRRSQSGWTRFRRSGAERLSTGPQARRPVASRASHAACRRWGFGHGLAVGGRSWVEAVVALHGPWKRARRFRLATRGPGLAGLDRSRRRAAPVAERSARTRRVVAHAVVDRARGCAGWCRQSDVGDRGADDLGQRRRMCVARAGWSAASSGGQVGVRRRLRTERDPRQRRRTAVLAGCRRRRSERPRICFGANRQRCMRCPSDGARVDRYPEC